MPPDASVSRMANRDKIRTHYAHPKKTQTRTQKTDCLAKAEESAKT
jgi:hypothetical protein